VASARCPDRRGPDKQIHKKKGQQDEGDNEMKAITVEPKKAGSTELENISEPDVRNGSLLVEAIAVGVCGTDVEIAEGKYGWAPPGKTRLVLGHE
jgi:D-arabinose 1-dehydrogenase-like Zn-dependent alcohol dehydrogenase